MFKTIILVLAISALAICSTDAPKIHENPWTKDSVNGSCNGSQQISKIQHHDGREFAQCMEIRFYGDNEQCSPPPNFENTKLSAYATMYGEKNTERACVVECSDAKTDCPEDSVCLPAEHKLRNTPEIRNMCYYPRSAPTPIPTPILPMNDYENPWVANVYRGECNEDEKLAVYENIYGRKFGHCMPVVTEYNVVGDSIYCPKPPAMYRHLAFAEVTSSDEDTVCVNECSHNLGCANGAYCMRLPFDRQSSTVKRACMFVKPRAWIRVEVEIDIEMEIDIYTN